MASDAALTTFLTLLRSTTPNLDLIASTLKSTPSLATDQLNTTGESALMIACQLGNLPLVTLLIDNGAVWNALDRSQNCAGDHAVKGCSQEVSSTMSNRAKRGG